MAEVKVKVNSCAPSSLHKRLQRQLDGIEKHLEMFPNDKLSQQRASTIRSELSR